MKKGQIHTATRWTGEGRVEAMFRVRSARVRWTPGWTTWTCADAGRAGRIWTASRRGNPEVQCRTERMRREELIAAGMQLDVIRPAARERYFVRAGGEAIEGGAFGSKHAADEWIALHRKDLDWRAGYSFGLKGLRTVIDVVDVNWVKVR